MTNTVVETMLSTLIEQIVERHHSSLRSELPFLEERIAEMCRNHGQDIPSLFVVQQSLQNLRDDLLPHLEKEEGVLFPYIVALEAARASGSADPQACFPSVRFPIRVMLREHDAALGMLREIRSVTGNFSVPPGLCGNATEFYRRLQALETDLHEHIRLENEVLFPRALQLEQ